jgi:ATP synthase protein I
LAVAVVTPQDADASASVGGESLDLDPVTPSTPASSPPRDVDNGMESYHRLRRRLLVATTVAAALAVPVVALTLGWSASLSTLLGALCGLLYLVLLSRSVSRLGVKSKSVGKVQLLVPIVLVLTATKVPQLQVLPALLGFLLYKPALLVQALLDA